MTTDQKIILAVLLLALAAGCFYGTALFNEP